MTVSLVSRAALALAGALALLSPGASHAQTFSRLVPEGGSPALCGPSDQREPGLQGGVPAGQTPSYNCGVKLLGELPISGNVQGAGTCAYVRLRPDEGAAPSPQSQIAVVDVSDPAKPVVVGEPLPALNRTETFRVVVTPERAILVSGSTVYDIKDCLNPKLLGDIYLPPNTLPGIPSKTFPHDLRINRAGTRIFYSFGLWEVDISNLADPESWKLTDHRCAIAEQIPGPWQELHRAANKAGRSLCADATKPVPQGSNFVLGTSPLVASMIWPQVSHSPDFNADDTRIYLGDQAGGNSRLWAPEAKTRIFDLTSAPYKLIGEVNGGGHGLDWFRAGGREYLLHSNEYGLPAFGDVPPDTCQALPRPTSLGWAFEAFISDVTDPAQARNVATLGLSINDPKFCEQYRDSRGNASIAYHLIDDSMNAHFAAVNFGTAGLRIFDIRNPEKPVEVAYFNHGAPVHGQVGHYNAARRLIYFSDAAGFKVLQLQPQVWSKLGL